MIVRQAPIPPPSKGIFTNGIAHPDLWLWDSWTLQEPSGTLHLYCLALGKVDDSGTRISPAERNDFRFHVRHFESATSGQSWQDRGAVLEAGQMPDGADGRNVWSGSVLRLDDGQVAFAFTGIRDVGADRCFVQSICVGIGSDPGRLGPAPAAAISCPLRDYVSIVSKGYYLGPPHLLGRNQGDEGGPIMAWRDPFLFMTTQGDIEAIWSAKLSPATPALAHARLRRAGQQMLLEELFPPIELPDAALMTQAEVPKLYRDPSTRDYLLLVSACDRQSETQPACEITHVLRLYRSPRITGPWQPIGSDGSKVHGLDGIFGASLLDHDLASGRLTFLGPYSENAGPPRQLSFNRIETIPLSLMAGTDQVKFA